MTKNVLQIVRDSWLAGLPWEDAPIKVRWTLETAQLVVHEYNILNKELEDRVKAHVGQW